jgi:hypothetical protein
MVESSFAEDCTDACIRAERVKLDPDEGDTGTPVS